jgi:hypothetical protein
MSFINAYTILPTDASYIGFVKNTSTSITYTNGVDSVTGGDYSIDNYTVPIGVWLILVNLYASISIPTWFVGTGANMYFNNALCNTTYYQEFPVTYYDGATLSGFTKCTILLNTTAYSSGATANIIKVYPNISTYNGTVSFTGKLYVTYTKIA